RNKSPNQQEIPISVHLSSAKLSGRLNMLRLIRAQLPTTHELTVLIQDHISSCCGIKLVNDRLSPIGPGNRFRRGRFAMSLERVLELLRVGLAIVSLYVEVFRMLEFLGDLLVVEFGLRRLIRCRCL